MPIERDPRMEPKDGDVFKKGRRTRRVMGLITNGKLGAVRFVMCLDLPDGPEAWPSLCQFQKWAVGAEVIHHVD